MLMRGTKMKTVVLSVCECQFPILNDSVPLGAEYVVETARRLSATLTCGGCKRSFRVDTVYATNAAGIGGYLPAAVFGL
jgi:hypothetical protein